MSRKYKLLARKKLPLELPQGDGLFAASETFSGLRRVVALVDIPRHGVKAGDIGGYVANAHILSQEGDCWVGGDAIVMGNTKVKENSLISDNAIIFGKSSSLILHIAGNAKVDGHAFVETQLGFYNPDYKNVFINEDAHIFGNACIKNALYISGSAQIYGNARIDNALFIDGNCRISEKAFLRGKNSVSGTSEIFGTTAVGTGTIISGNSKIGTSRKSLYVPANKKFTDVTMTARNVDKLPELRVENKKNISEIMRQIRTGKDKTEYVNELEKRIVDSSAVLSDDQTISIQTLDDIAARIDGYQKDIVKIIKYPLMVDTTDPFTSKMMMLFNKAQRLRSFSDNKQFSETVDALEEAFLAAESNALRLSVTKLSEDEKKKTAKATDLLRIAMDDAASENEKQVAFKQGLKQLEGIILIPEHAVETFRVKAGIAQLTA